MGKLVPYYWEAIIVWWRLQQESKKVTHVLNTAKGLEIFPIYIKEVASLTESGIKFLNLNWIDNEGQKINDSDLQTAIEFIEAARLTGGDVLVHCAQGKSRSSTVVLAYLMAKSLCSDTDSALKFTQERRKMAEPNPGFMSKLKLWRESSSFRPITSSSS